MGDAPPKLVFLIQGPKRTARLNLEGPFFVVGRGEAFPVFHDDPTLSREHATIVDTPQGYRVKDLGSRNGVTINGKKVARYGEAPLEEGDLLQAGNTTIRLIDVAELERRKAEQAAAAEEEDEELTVDDAGRTGAHPVVAPDRTPTGSMDAVGTATELALEEDEDGELTVGDDEPLMFPGADEETLEMDRPDLDPPTLTEDDIPTQDIDAADALAELEAREKPLTAEELVDLGEMAAQIEDVIPTQMELPAASEPPPDDDETLLGLEPPPELLEE